MNEVLPNWSGFLHEDLITEIQNLWSGYQKKLILQKELLKGLNLFNQFKLPLSAQETRTEEASKTDAWDQNALLNGVGLHNLWVQSEGQKGKRLCLTGQTLRDELSFAGLWLLHSDMRNANFAHRDFSNTNLIRAEMSGSCFDNAKLQYATLALADLSGISARHADFAYANLGLSQLKKADLAGACLFGVNLQYASLAGADLSGADLRSAFLLDADLEGANLTGVQWDGADLSGACLDGATMDNPIDKTKVIFQ